jgi:Ca2+/Na+ antiporter
MQSLEHAVRALIPSQYYYHVLVLLGIIAALAILFATRRDKPERPNYILAILIVILLLMLMASDVTDRWAWMLGLLPTLLVAYQAFYLWLSKPEEVEAPATQAQDQIQWQKARDRAHDAIESQFGVKTLFIRYAFPAALLAIVGVVVINVLVKPGQFLSLITLNQLTIVRIDQETAKKILLGLRLGALGAYVYVLLELGRRTFRHDVTGASAMWCLVTLVLGPVMAAGVAVLWRINPPSPTETNWWAGGVVLFFAGYAPRRIIAAIEQAAIQLLKIGGGVVAPTRQIPLTQVRGISPQIAERLSEEGIEDVNALASVEPIRLYRNTSFDLRQILIWIDEAMLIVTLPRHWEALEEHGIRGAIDVAFLEDFVGTLPPKERPPTPLEELAAETKVPLATLRATSHRLHEDRQLLDVWVLYNNFTESLGGTSTGTGDGSIKGGFGTGGGSVPAGTAGEPG